MAEAAISFAVEKLGDLLIQKVGFLRGVEGQVQWLRDEFQRMQCFLKDAAELQGNDERIRKWISDIREVAQDADDVVESFFLRVDSPRRSRGIIGRCACFPSHVYHLDKVGEDIESVRKRLLAIDKSRERYGIQNLGEGTVSLRGSEDVERRRRLSPWQKDKHLVDLQKDVLLLLQRAILVDKEGLFIAAIIGMGGIGKSTLARVVYNHADVANRFDRRAWVVLSREFNPKEIIKDLMIQLPEPVEDKLKLLETMEKLELQSLQRMLHDRLQGRRYFIVVDDVWENAHWETLAPAFPDDDKASRLLFTSRNRNIPIYAQYIHEMKILDPKKSWELFLKKAFIDNSSNKCPLELENIGRQILRKCNGLPLAVTVVGGLLVRRTAKSEWEKVLRGMDSHLGRSRNSVSAILELSYHNLPPQLKSCFLCLGFFKEDATINAKKLLQVWIAEGLISDQGLGQESRETMEEVARSYLDELINRNMIQVKDLSMDDRVKNCHMHDLLRELSITKAKEEINFEILKEGSSQSSSGKPRHRAIYCSGESFSYSANTNTHIRSLFFHGFSSIDVNPSYWRSFELLRVLDFEDFGLKILPDAVGELIALRYLGLRNNNLNELPISLSRLKNLQVLDIAWNLKVKVPNIIWKMDSLRHLYMSEISCQEPLKIKTLKNLQTLEYIPMADWMREGEQPTDETMNSLRKLGIKLDSDSDLTKLCTSLAKLENLVHLNLVWSHLPSNSSLDKLGILRGLTRLKLRGAMIKLPNFSNFPPNLSYLSLVDSFLDKDPMPILEKLPKLLYLKLSEAYRGSKMVISGDGFPRLKVLCLQGLHMLGDIEVQKGAMPELQRLEVYRCPHWENLPEELKLMSNLQS